MVFAGEYRAVVDRFHEEVAVLVVLERGDPVDELAIDRSVLPTEDVRVDATFRVELAAGQITSIEPIAGDTGPS